MTEASATFPCLGAECAALVGGDGALGSAADAVALARRRLTEWHARFTRFAPDSELSALNADPRSEVPATAAMARFAAAVRRAGQRTGGLVDATLLDPLERAGYASDLGPPLPLADALRSAPARRPAGPNAAERWRSVRATRRSVIRPPGVQLDSGGLAKGLFADLLAAALATYASFAIDCAGDVRVGGTLGRPRPVEVLSPFDSSVVHTLRVTAGAVATSGIGRRSWRAPNGAPAHHLLDPATGRPAFTGIVQATALAPTALEAEMRAKAALLSGPAAAARWLPHGGVVVHDDATLTVLPGTSKLSGDNGLRG
jgi:thiamine biosynthesis lipoprotein